MRCRLILLISEHPIQQGIRKGGVRHFGHEDEDGRGRTDRMAYSRQLDCLEFFLLLEKEFVTGQSGQNDKNTPKVETTV